jgi:hypothetical protein
LQKFAFLLLLRYFFQQILDFPNFFIEPFLLLPILMYADDEKRVHVGLINAERFAILEHNSN